MCGSGLAAQGEQGTASLIDVGLTNVRWGVSVKVFKQKRLWNCRVLIVYLEMAVEIGLTTKILKAVSTLQKFSPYCYDKRLPQLQVSATRSSLQVFI